MRKKNYYNILEVVVSSQLVLKWDLNYTEAAIIWDD